MVKRVAAMLPFFVFHNFVVLLSAQNCNIRIKYFALLR